MSYTNRNYVIFNYSEAGNIDYDQVLDDSISTLWISNDGIQTFVSYEGNMPSSVIALTTKSSQYSHGEMMNILSGDNWIDLNPPQ
tara:strand:+ start:526 stop:780 length:255 start_codon:yes stop_codon:yes gene_type:complete